MAHIVRQAPRVAVKKSILLAVSAAALLMCGPLAQSQPAPSSSATAVPAASLIPRAALFGNPSRAGATISPDGKWIAFLAPRDGVLNIWVAPTGAIDKAKPLSAETDRPIGGFNWSPDSSRILYLQDKGGTEDFQLYGVDLDAKTTAYTPFAKTRAGFAAISPEVKDAILITLNKRDPQWNDVYRLELASGKLTEVWRNPGGYSDMTADRKFNPVLAQKALDDGGGEVFRIDAGGAMTSLFKFGLEDSQTTAVVGARDPRHVYMVDSRGRDKAQLTVFDPVSGESKLIGADDRSDIGGLIEDPATGELEAYSYDYLTKRWVGLTPAVKADIAFLDAQTKGQWDFISQSDDDRLWTLSVDKAGQPPAEYLFDRKAHRLTKLYTNRPELEGQTLAAMHPLEIKARDGLTLVSYLTLPAGADADGDGVPDHPVPLVLLVHGGPWARDEYGYNGTHQWLANRGYAVLSVNYRASTGFGKGFISAGDKQWGRKMHDDLIDAVDYAVKARITTADKVAIMGGSYGGYATLAGVTMTPKTFKCGVDIVGPSNLFTLLQTIPPYWAAIYEQFAQRMGDPRTEAGRALLKERSPLTYVDQIQVPLLIGQGVNDPRVNKRESDQIVEAMKARSIPVTYVVYPDEGHGFHRPQNRTSFNAVTEGFLSACLGGAAQPIGGDLKGSSLQVPDGADRIPGLVEALAGQPKP
jgi:dipeptidyl aminopeptidase/acylaminoacyl peptidase